MNKQSFWLTQQIDREFLCCIDQKFLQSTNKNLFADTQTRIYVNHFSLSVHEFS